MRSFHPIDGASPDRVQRQPPADGETHEGQDAASKELQVAEAVRQLSGGQGTPPQTAGETQPQENQALGWSRPVTHGRAQWREQPGAPGADSAPMALAIPR